MLQVDIDHEMLNSFFGDQRPGFSGLSRDPSFEDGFPFDKEDQSLQQMFLPDTPLKGKKSNKTRKAAAKSPKRKRQYTSKKPVDDHGLVQPTWKKPQCLKLMVDITKLEPLSSKERSETESNYSEEDFNELMSMVLDDPAASASTYNLKTEANGKLKPKPKRKAKRSTNKHSSSPKGTTAAKPKPKPKLKLKLPPKPKPAKQNLNKNLSQKQKPKMKTKQNQKPKPKLKLKPMPNSVAKKKSIGAVSKPKIVEPANVPSAKPKTKLKATAAPAKKPKSKAVKRKVGKASEERDKKKTKLGRKTESLRLGLKRGNGLPSPDSSATTFDFMLEDYDFSLDVLAAGDAANKRRRTKWHDDDTKTLWEGILRYGNNWSEIKNMLPGRTYYQVKDKGRRLLHHKGWKTGRSKNDACGAGEYAKNIAKSMLANSGGSPRRSIGMGDMNVNHSLVNLKLPSVAANA